MAGMFNWNDVDVFFTFNFELLNFKLSLSEGHKRLIYFFNIMALTGITSYFKHYDFGNVGILV